MIVSSTQIILSIITFVVQCGIWYYVDEIVEHQKRNNIEYLQTENQLQTRCDGLREMDYESGLLTIEQLHWYISQRVVIQTQIELMNQWLFDIPDTLSINPFKSKVKVRVNFDRDYFFSQPNIGVLLSFFILIIECLWVFSCIIGMGLAIKSLDIFAITFVYAMHIFLAIWIFFGIICKYTCQAILYQMNDHNNHNYNNNDIVSKKPGYVVSHSKKC